MALFSKGSAENRLTDIQRDKLPIRAVDVHKTKRVSTTHWLTNWGGWLLAIYKHLPIVVD